MREFLAELAKVQHESPQYEFEFWDAARGEWRIATNLATLVHRVEIFGDTWRRRHRSMVIGSQWVPRPLMAEPAEGSRLFVADPCHHSLAHAIKWGEGARIRHWLRRGLVHTEVGDARGHAEALIRVSGGQI